MPNRLANETSPYLLQHAHNPVDWYAWGEDAFAKARELDRPIFLSIGYSACHWCHVMERESFEDDRTAAILNENFVSVKVDREERPDVDSIYMQAVQMMTGHGGWPMSMFLTPDRTPFYGGTYFPPDDRAGMPSFRRVLEHVSAAYRERRDEVGKAGAEMREALARSVRAAAPAAVTPETLANAASRIIATFDRVHGGFGAAPKFPPAVSLLFLLNEAAMRDDSMLLHAVTFTLRKMANGGMYDQVGGGFHRYSVDARWLVPHFEKMLYDNALLARTYTRAWQLTQQRSFRRVAEETLDFVAREMTSPEGGFYSSLDADSEGEEGKFYVWSRAEVLEILGDDGPLFCELFDITDEGNFEGHNIPNAPVDRKEFALQKKIEPDELESRIARARERLYAARSRRFRPGRDEKILTGWNGWMLAAYAEAALAFGREKDREIVGKNADFLLRTMFVEGRLQRSFKDGRARIQGLLEDHAGLALGLIGAFEVTQNRAYLDRARELANDVVARFRDAEHGGFFDTAADHEELITRPKDLFDNATPGGNSVMAEVLLKLAAYFDEEALRSEGTKLVESLAPLAEKYAPGFGYLLSAASLLLGGLREIVVLGEGERHAELVRVAGETFAPHRIFVTANVDLPIARDKRAGEAIAFVCRNYVCAKPTSDPGELRAGISRSV
jgi:uncharacterized protein